MGMGEEGRFPQTRWSLVEAAGDEPDQGARPALTQLLLRYLPALRAHLIQHKHLGADLADELLQSFVARRVLETQLIARADRNRGKFRTFLLTALDHFVSNELRSQRAQRRGGLHLRSLESEFITEPCDHSLGPSRAFDVEWARTVVAEAVQRMRLQCQTSGRIELWELFNGRVLAPTIDHQPAMAYELLVERFGFATPSQASNAVVTAKRMFARLLREVVSEYLDDPQQADAEVRELRSILAGGRA